MQCKTPFAEKVAAEYPPAPSLARLKSVCDSSSIKDWASCWLMRVADGGYGDCVGGIEALLSMIVVVALDKVKAGLNVCDGG